MKLRIRESNFLHEDIDAVRKYYPNIPDDIFMQLISLDPTYRNNNSLGKYGKWILNLYNKGNLAEEEFEEVTPLLQQFTTYRNRVANKDLNAYKSLQELSDVLAAVVDDDSMLTQRQKVRFLKNVKAGRTKVSAEDDYEVAYQDDEWVVYIPHTHEASMKLGDGTKWCTAHENPDWYNRYTDGGHKLYIICDKDVRNGKDYGCAMYQYSEKTHDFLDFNDDKVDMEDFVEDISDGLYKYLNKLDNKVFWKAEIIGGLKVEGNRVVGYVDNDYIGKSITVPDGITYIMPNAFESCTCDTVELPNSLITIGDSAFAKSDIESIDIPNSVENIYNYAFIHCRRLKSIKLSTGIYCIPMGCFYHCKSLESINIPDVDSVKQFAFHDCTSLKRVKFNDNCRLSMIGEHAFDNCPFESIILPSNESTGIAIYSQAFYNCHNLKKITIVGMLGYVDVDAFSGCSDDLTIYVVGTVVKRTASRLRELGIKLVAMDGHSGG